MLKSKCCTSTWIFFASLRTQVLQTTATLITAEADKSFFFQCSAILLLAWMSWLSHYLFCKLLPGIFDSGPVDFTCSGFRSWEHCACIKQSRSDGHTVQCSSVKWPAAATSRARLLLCGWWMRSSPPLPCIAGPLCSKILWWVLKWQSGVSRIHENSRPQTMLKSCRNHAVKYRS